MNSSLSPHQVLKKYWGFDDFRPLQLDIIKSVLEGRDTLGLMPTGGGKSVTFQIPALIFPGLTLVVTPLISLMKDQVDNLKARGIKAAMVYSGMTTRERNLAYDHARLGKIKLLYISPERLRSENFKVELRKWNVSFIVVDEAHCISQWGYDFRPSYLKIVSLRETYPDVPMLALTASATPVVRKDIIENLCFRPGFCEYALSFHRDNLSYVVRYCTEGEKETRLVDALRAVTGSAIVYVRSRIATARYAESLTESGIPATFYHAGLDADTKEKRQQSWKENKVRVIVATNAFGMGIDKPDVRLVVHLDIPPSLEEYYQEAGRAGRDGLRSYALTLASVSDKRKLTRRLNAAYPPREYILNVYEKACVFMDIPVGEGYGHVYEFDPVKFSKTFRLDRESVRGALNILTNAGYFDYNDDPASRARVQILIKRDEFYSLRLEHSEQELINIILRLYPGLFADYVSIDEDTIATAMHVPREDVYQAFLSLSRKKILHYVPKRLLPYIYLPTARELTKYVTIPRNIYEDRRDLMRQRIEAMRQFVFGQDECRDKILLRYFGEDGADDCDMCDVCVDRRKNKKKASMTTDEISGNKEKLREHLLDCVRKYPGVTVQNLVSAMPGVTDDVFELLRTLIADNRLRREGDSLFCR